MTNKSKTFLASLAVFRKLYDNNKDIYQVISEFLKDIILSRRLYNFNSTEITGYLKEVYDFDIPEAVVRTALKRLKEIVYKVEGGYAIKDASIFNEESDNLHIYEEEVRHDKFLNRLFNYIETKRKYKLNEEEKKRIIDSFCSFILNGDVDKTYSSFISAFIIDNQKNEDFRGQLSAIKEGVVLYVGLKFNPNPSEIKRWRRELTIFLDTEILFHAVGYNGRLYKVLFDDFYNLVVEINKGNNKQLIRLKYFQDTEHEINHFFTTAENIVRRGSEGSLNPSKTAMFSILNGCKSPADIIEKKAKFFQELNAKSITKFSEIRDFYTEKLQKYNFESEDLLNSLKEEININDEDLYSIIRILNYVNILRRYNKANVTSLEEVGFIFLTGTGNVLKTASASVLRKDEEVPLATTISFLTDKFWFKLNKGFGKEIYPKSFDVVAKAQIVLSSQLRQSVSEDFDELNEKLKKGDLTKEDAVTILAELRHKSSNPENITEENIDDILGVIEEDRIEYYLREKKLLESQIKRKHEESQQLRDRIDALEKENIKNKEELERFREIEERGKRHKERIRKIASFTLMIAIIFFCILYNKILGYLLGGLSFLLTVLLFFGIDWRKIKNIFIKDK